MKIRDIRTHLLTAKWASDPYFPVLHHCTALIEILTDAGLSGVGETILGYFAPEAVPALVDFYKPLLLGENPARITALWKRMYLASIPWGRSGAAMAVISGIDIALWDLKAKALNVPLYQLLGGAAKDSLRVYCSGGPALWPIEANVAKCKHYLEKGYTAVKFATGYYERDATAEGPSAWRLQPVSRARIAEEERIKCAAVREALGKDIDIILDGHQGAIAEPYSLQDALEITEAIAPYGLLFFEEPLPYTQPEGYAELRRHGRVPIAGGENLSGMHEFRAFFEKGALDIVQPEITLAGGVTLVRNVVSDAANAHLQVAPHCGGTAGPGLASSIHLAFACPATLILEHVLHAEEIQRDLMLEPIRLANGTIRPPTAPGLGIQLSDSLLAKYPFIPGMGEVC